MKKLIIIIVGCIQCIYAQSVTEIEADLLQNLKQISKYGAEKNTDSLAFYNQNFSDKLLNYTSKNAQMLNYNFPSIGENYWSVATSPDGKFRIYSWDTQEGGSMRFYQNIFQWKDYDTLYAKKNEIEEGMPGGFYSQIFQLTDELNTFYICYFNSVLSGRNCYHAIYCMDFERKEFSPKFNKIKTKSGITNKLGFSNDFFSVADNEERPIKLIKFNNITNTISIPVVNAEGKVSSKSIFYKYDGDYFLRVVPSKK
jgi:hypothetical protein